MKKLELIDQMNIAKAADVRKQKDGELAKPTPSFRPGDTITVAVRVVEGEKERIQNFTGVVIARRGSGTNATFRVRRISNGVGVERIFPLHSPNIQGIKIERGGAVRRSKLYYLRGMSEKKIRQKLHQN